MDLFMSSKIIISASCHKTIGCDSRVIWVQFWTQCKSTINKTVELGNKSVVMTCPPGDCGRKQANCTNGGCARERPCSGDGRCRWEFQEVGEGILAYKYKYTLYLPSKILHIRCMNTTTFNSNGCHFQQQNLTFAKTFLLIHPSKAFKICQNLLSSSFVCFILI